MHHCADLMVVGQTPQTTRLYFSDGSYAFMSNQTWYGSDGTFIDFATRVYEVPNGTVVHFTPEVTSSASTVPVAGPSSTVGTGGSTSPAATVNGGIKSVVIDIPLGIFLVSV